MARLTIEPVYTSSTGTHKSLIISGHDLLGSTRPNWVISLETDESDAETVETLISTLEGYFNQPQNDHTSAKLYQLIVRHLPQSQNYSISALVFDNTSLHLLSFGNVQVSLKRINREAILLDSKKADWSIIKGKWLINDVFEVSVGKSKIEVCIKDSEPEPDLEPNPNLNDKQDLIEKPKKRFIMILGFIVLALLIVSVFFGAKARTQKRLQASWDNLARDVSQSISSAQSLKATDQVKARQQLRELQESFTQTRKDFENNKQWLEKWEGLNAQIESNYSELAGVAALEDIPVWFSLSVVRPDLMGSRLGFAGESLLILDEKSGTLVRVDTTSKRAEVVAGGENIQNASAVTGAGNRAILVTSKGIVEVALTKKTSAILIEPDSVWQKIEDIAIFNNNLYLLDGQAGEIWRYPAIANGLGERQRWLGNGVSLPTGAYREMAVDGDLWLIRSEGQINRYRRGAPLSLSLSGLDTPLGSNTPAFAVSPDQDAVIIIDSTNQRAVRFTKQGVYVKQINWSGFASAKDVVLSPDAKFLYILKDNIIYATPI